jgi:membrane-associated phospholipid phosphatase
MTIGPLFKLWCLMLAAALIGVAICIRWLDVPVAMAFLGNANRFSGLGRGLSSTVLIFGEMLLITVLAIARLMRGDLPEFGKALFVASCASLSAYVANDHVLKFIFGRENPLVLFQGIPPHVFNFFQGDQHSSFPSGHMVMATAFAVAMIRLQPRTLPILTILLFIGAAALVIGDWHFIGDVIAGIFVGATAGLVAGELWSEHVRKHAPT